MDDKKRAERLKQSLDDFPEHAKHILKPYGGDKFGESLCTACIRCSPISLLYLGARGMDNSYGMIYLSRMEAQRPSDLLNPRTDTAAFERRGARQSEHPELDDITTESMQIGRYRRIAYSLATLSSKPDKLDSMVNNGAIATIGRLIRQSDDPHIMISCAKALSNLAASSSVRRRLIEENALNALSSLRSFEDKRIQHVSIENYRQRALTLFLQICLKAIVNMTSGEKVENDLVTQGIIPILLDAAMSGSYFWKKQALVGLVNLTCVETKFNLIQELNEVWGPTDVLRR